MKTRLAYCLWVVLCVSCGSEQQVGDTSYAPHIENPAFSIGTGPVVKIDEAHHNMHSLTGFYRPFGDLLRADGFQVDRLRVPIATPALDGAGVVVISNALPAATEEEADTLGSAFTDAELDALVAWVRNGGFRCLH